MCYGGGSFGDAQVMVVKEGEESTVCENGWMVAVVTKQTNDRA